MKIRKESETPFYVIITKSKAGKEFAWGGSNNLKKTERILLNPLAFPEGKYKRVEKFANRAAAYDSQWKESLEIACGRLNWRPLING